MSRSPQPAPPIQVLHIASGDRWAGAEVQLHTLLVHLNRRDDVRARAVLLNEGETAERLRAAGIPLDVLDETRLSSLQILLGLRRLIRRHRPDLLHTHRQKENVLGALANLTTLRLPSLRTVHGAPEHAPPWSQPHKRLFRWLDLFVGRHLQQRIIAVSQDLGRQLAAVFPAERITVIENGVDVEAVRAQAAPPADFRLAKPDHKHIGIVGRLVPVKRVDLFLDMAAELLARDLPWPLAFHVIGDGPLREELMETARRRGLADAVTFHGHRQDIHACLAGLDVLVMCSDHEGMPMAALEALALGVGVVGNDVGGLSELLGGTAAGVLLLERTGAAYADAVTERLRSSGGPAQPESTLREALPARFSAQHNARSSAAAYITLTGNSATA